MSASPTKAGLLKTGRFGHSEIGVSALAEGVGRRRIGGNVVTTVPGLRIGAAPRAGIPLEGVRDLLSQVLSVARQHLGMEVAFVSRVAGGRRVFEFVDTVADFTPIEVGDSDALQDTYCGRVLDGRLPGLVVDARAEPAVADLAATTQMPIGTHLSVPVYTGTSVYGTLCCFSRNVLADVSTVEIDTLRMFADIVGKHLQPLVDRAREAADEQALLGELLDEGGPVIVVQPIIELASRNVWAYETLSRFPARDGWGPQDWFNAADRVGLGVALESAAVHNALDLLPQLAPGIFLSVNVSARALLSSASITAMLTSHAGEHLIVEVTEHERIDDPQRLHAVLTLTRAAGVRVAVDDAGSGFAGLEHILTIAPEILKLDRALIQAISTDPARQAMCEAMVNFCRRTDTTIVAEGVETPQDLETLRTLGVTHAQGYLLGRPAPYQ